MRPVFARQEMGLPTISRLVEDRGKNNVMSVVLFVKVVVCNGVILYFIYKKNNSYRLCVWVSII